MEVATDKAQLEKIETEIKQHCDGHRGCPGEALCPDGRGRGKEGRAVRHPPPAGHAHREEPDADQRARTSHLAPEQLDEEYAAKQAQLAENQKASPTLPREERARPEPLRSWREASLPSAPRSNGSAVRSRHAEQDAIRLEAAQQARGESGGKAIDGYGQWKESTAPSSTWARLRARYTTTQRCRGEQAPVRGLRHRPDCLGRDPVPKDERLGRVTFLPLNKLKPPQLPPIKETGRYRLRGQPCRLRPGGTTRPLPLRSAQRSWSIPLSGPES